MSHNDVINDDVTYLTLDEVFDDNETSSDDEVVRPDWNIVSNFLDHSTQYRSSTSLVMVLVYNLPSRERNLIFLDSVLIWVRPDTIRICSSSSSRGRFSFRGASSSSHELGHLVGWILPGFGTYWLCWWGYSPLIENLWPTGKIGFGTIGFFIKRTWFGKEKYNIWKNSIMKKYNNV